MSRKFKKNTRADKGKPHTVKEAKNRKRIRNNTKARRASTKIKQGSKIGSSSSSSSSNGGVGTNLPTKTKTTTKTTTVVTPRDANSVAREDTKNQTSTTVE